MRLGLAVACGLLLAVTSAPARAGDKEDCIAASEEADRLDDAGKLIELGERLGLCARDACPNQVRQECTRRLEELARRIPTIIVRATDDRGVDIVNARVLVDDRVVAAQIDGRPIKLDPGPHVVQVQPVTGESRVQDVVAAEGDHLRQVTLRYAPDGGATPPAKDGGAPATTPGDPVKRWIGVGLVGVGAVALGYGVYALVAGIGNENKFEAEGLGKPNCGPTVVTGCHLVDSSGLTYAGRANRFYLQMAVVGGIGLASATVGTILLLTSLGSKRDVKRNGVRLTPALGPGYAGFSLGGAF